MNGGKERRDLLFKRFNRHGGQGAYNRHNKARNEYLKIGRQAQVHREKDIVDKCKSQPKQFYSCIKSKNKVTDKI